MWSHNWTGLDNKSCHMLWDDSELCWALGFNKNTEPLIGGTYVTPTRWTIDPIALKPPSQECLCILVGRL